MPSPLPSSRFRGWPAALGLGALALIWGTQFLIIRVGQRSVPPLLTLALRYLVLALIAHALTLALRPRAPAGLVPARVAFGVMQALTIGLLYWAEGHVASSVAAFITMTEPVLIAMLAPLLIVQERFSARALISMLFGFVGIVLLTSARDPGAEGTRTVHGLAVTSLVVSAVVGALARIFGKHLVHKLSPLIILRDNGWIVAAVAAAGSLAFERDRRVTFGTGAILAFVYLGVVGSAAASGLYLVLLRRYSVTKMAWLQYVTPLVAMAAGVLVGGERLGLAAYAGAAVIMLGLALLLLPAFTRGISR